MEKYDQRQSVALAIIEIAEGMMKPMLRDGEDLAAHYYNTALSDLISKIKQEYNLT